MIVAVDREPLCEHGKTTSTLRSHLHVAEHCNVEEPSRKPTNTMRRQRGRKVTINEDCNCVFPDLLRTRDECCETWHESKDYERFRATTEALVKTIVHSETIASQTNPDSYLNILDRIYESCCEMEYESSDPTAALSIEEEAQLNEVFQQMGGFLRVGLESRIAISITRDVHRKRSQLLNIMGDLQLQAWKSNCTSMYATTSTDCTASTLSEEMEDEVYQSSLALSRAARLFSQQLARAQLLAT